MENNLQKATRKQIKVLLIILILLFGILGFIICKNYIEIEQTIWLATNQPISVSKLDINSNKQRLFKVYYEAEKVKSCSISNISVSSSVKPVSKISEYETFVITAYCSCEKCCGKYAATNTDSNGNVRGAAGQTLVVGKSVAACTCIPFGTTFNIDGYGEVVVQDRMAHKDNGKHLDLFMESHEAALQWGKQELLVSIVK